MQFILFYGILYFLTRSKDTGLALFACCSNGDFALTRQSVMPLLYSTCPVDQIYRASVVPSLLGKTEDKEMTEMWVPLPEGYSMGNAWPQLPSPPPPKYADHLHKDHIQTDTIHARPQGHKHCPAPHDAEGHTIIWDD